MTRRARAEKLPFQDVQRARIVLYAAAGLHDTEIAARLDTTAGIVGKWRKRFYVDRLEGLKDKPRAGRPRRFPPEQVAAVKAVACELPVRYGLPLGRFSRTELYRLVIELAVTDASASTIWRWLHEDAIKPWQQQCWIYQRDPEFAVKAGRALDLYARVFEGKRLRPDEYVISSR